MYIFCIVSYRCYFILLCDTGIVLKNARITKKGTSKSNVASGTVVDTLVILSSNIVQIVAEVRSFVRNLLTSLLEVHL